MTVPTTREQHKEYCLKNLGKPVIDINVNNEQLDDRIDESLQYYRDYHFDGTQNVYIAHAITDTDVTNRYVSLDEDIVGVTRVLPLGGTMAGASSSLFNLNYQFSSQDIWDSTRANMTHFVIAQHHIALIQEILVGQQPLRFNRHTDRVWIDMDWDNLTVGEYIVIDGYQLIDPDVYTDVWNDRWLLEYTTQLFKRQWGRNLSKFEGMQLPGGVSFSGRQILEDAEVRIKELQEEIVNSYSLPVFDMMG
tara:strand:- start:721 stop:1467 length:747 start_codon:yes stop_codon:yes gene_type:complete